MAERKALTRAKRVVIKVGSRTLASDPNVYDRLARAVGTLHREERSVVLVSSGAIALGVRRLGWKARPREMARLQAAAAAGQSALMLLYEQAFQTAGLTVAQVLLTHADLADRVRGNNARAAMQALLEAGAVPILNENDSVSVEEIKFGDNDQLAALVAPLVDADLVILLSDVEGLLGSDGKRIPIVRDVAKDALPHIRQHAGSGVGTGGMASKVEAARRATFSGAHAVVADARQAGVIEAVLHGEDVGTLFVGRATRLPAKKSWIAFTLRPRGALLLDAGAAHAVQALGKSILPVGVIGVRGDFREGDAVRLMAPDGIEIGRGLVRCAAADAARIAGLRARELPPADAGHAVLVHRDDLVVGVNPA
jgi:glutamate 5-kinase